jgi:uncharacterized protein (DUF433 family)
MKMWNSYSEFLGFGYKLSDDIKLVYGQHIFSIRGLCGGIPVVGSHRISVENIAGFVKSGDTVAYVAHTYNIPVSAVIEALEYYNLNYGDYA